MSTPAQLLLELRAIQKHYAATAERKARILMLMENQTAGTWVDAIRAPLVLGRLYFVRVKWANGGTSPVSLWEWSSSRVSWSTVYGTDHKLSSGDRLQVLVSTQVIASLRRRPQGGRA